MDSGSTPRFRAGSVYVEQDGTYQLKPLDKLMPGEKTYWGTFRGITMVDGEFYFAFLKQRWNPHSESYEGSESRIAVTALVHPRAKIAHSVIVEPYAVVAQGAELMTGAHVERRQVIANAKRFHHLMDGKQPLTNSAVV